MTLNELLIEVRKAELAPDSGKALRSLLVESGPLMQVLCGVLEYRDGMTESLTKVNLLSEDGRLDAVKRQGIILGIDVVLDLVHRMAYDQAQVGEQA